MISIITVTYNAERFLERTIRSIVAQQQAVLGVDYEYLVIDGASTDGTLALVRTYETHISHWQSEPDKGLYDAMNKGLHMARGAYVWFMNAGDELHDEQVLAKLLAQVRSQPPDNPVDVYYSDALFVNEDGTPVGLRSQITPHTLPMGGGSDTLRWQDMALGMKVSHQAFVARREVAPDYPMNNLSADLDWEIRCLKAAKRVEFVPFVLCRYLVGGLSKQQHRRSLTDRFKVLTWHFGLLPTLWNHARIVWRAVGHKKNL
ncbi:glycosyltransferase family 2 protein [Fibrella forsythiae]|uniref:Glycosyltransferase n=1 Tax=Fibrella forsythiae TaxID=2817061 RepID=A0ABS3JHL3_9BACT|nr:glycosyltransferase family 2 protein [Fibrella forsythiae]MBO0949509.1 glycosyltransferase [Fibrella forsythiae]